MRHRQKIAIARLISELIKSDTLISHQEIAAYNKLVRNFDILDSELVEAQYLSLVDALTMIKSMSDDDQQRFIKTFYDAAHSDNRCTSKEALLILTVSNILQDKEGKYNLFSCEMKDSQMFEKYVIYTESDYMPVINDEILLHYDTIVNLLKLWNFEFIYIPKISQSFRDMDNNYLYDILRYMNPRLSTEMIEILQERLASFTTESYTCDYLTHTYNLPFFYDVQPSLLINIGTSILPSKIHPQQEISMLNLLTIRLDDEENSVFHEVRRFIDQYEQYITEPEICRTSKGKGRFRYYGLYKQLFDFLVRNRTDSSHQAILIDITTRRIWMHGEEIPLSATQLATYLLILHQTFCTHHAGLVKARHHYPLSQTEVERLTFAFRTIYSLFRENPISNQHTYLDEVNNIRTYIARIRMIITNSIDSDDVTYYLPKDSIHKDMYHVTLDPSRITLRDSNGEYEFVRYPLWMKFN
jgi:uncharacterized tellurite resistance protein B-like protein